MPLDEVFMRPHLSSGFIERTSAMSASEMTSEIVSEVVRCRTILDTHPPRDPFARLLNAAYLAGDMRAIDARSRHVAARLVAMHPNLKQFADNVAESMAAMTAASDDRVRLACLALDVGPRWVDAANAFPPGITNA